MSPTVFLNPVRATTGSPSRDGQSPATASSAAASAAATAAAKVLAFHQQVPHYEETPLHTVPQLAEELQLGHVFIKDESNRFGLPSFKILGASWAVVRAVVDELGLDLDNLSEGNTEQAQMWQNLASAASVSGVSLVTCTEGNWGRAVARMAKYLTVPAKIYVPSFMPETTRARIRSEGAEVIVVAGNYDDSVAAARQEADAIENAILVMDIGWDGYETIPGVGTLR